MWQPPCCHEQNIEHTHYMESAFMSLDTFWFLSTWTEIQTHEFQKFIWWSFTAYTLLCLASLTRMVLKFTHVTCSTVISCLLSDIPLRAPQVALVVKNLPANAGDAGDSGSILRWRRPPWRGNPLQCSCLEISRGGGVWELQSVGPQSVRHDRAHTQYSIK